MIGLTGVSDPFAVAGPSSWNVLPPGVPPGLKRW